MASPHDQLELDGKVALITGGSSGIGYGIAQRFLAAGARIAIASSNQARVMAAASNLGGATDVIGIQMDVTKPQDVETGVAHMIATFGGVDILISNAGIQIVHPIEAFPFDDWRRLLAVHLDGAFLTTKACLPHMYAKGAGSIIYMGSVHSHTASPLKSAYVTAKHGLIGLARTVATEGATKGVRANVICPGFVKTPLVEKQIPLQAKSLRISEEEVVASVMLGKTLDKQFTTIADVAAAAMMFATDKGALTGQSLILSHGWHMQ